MHLGNLIINRLITKLEYDNEVLIFDDSKSKSQDTRNSHKAKNINMSIKKKSFWELLYYIYKYSTIGNSKFVFHSLNPKIFLALYILRLLRLCKPRIIWVCWGEGTKNKSHSLTGQIINSIQSKIYNNLEKILVLLDSDKKSLIENFYCDPKKVIIIPYPRHLRITSEDISLLESKNKNTQKHILIGHSANPSIDHKKWINILSSLPEKQNLVIYMFLNYSANSIYIDKVITTAKAKFSDENLNLFTNFLPVEDYYQCYRSMNFYINSAKRQFGLGATYTAIMNGLTLYLDVEGANGQWLNYIGIKFKDINKICSDGSITPLETKVLIENAKRLEQFMKEKSSIDRWHHVLLE